jgi:hypothetical protein
MTKVHFFTEPANTSDKFSYMLLGRYEADILYFLGSGGRNERHLYFNTKEEHIKETINQWKKLSPKPEWLRASKLIEYKKRMLNN